MSILKILLGGLLMLAVSGCTTTFRDLQPPAKTSYFVLEKTVYRVNINDDEKKKWSVRGLRAGRYQLVGEDKTGYYYLGPPDADLWLWGEVARRFLKEGYITPYKDRAIAHFPLIGGTGGIWIPKDRATAKIQFFSTNYVGIERNPAYHDNSGTSGTGSPSANMSSAYGVTGSVIAHMVDGSIDLHPLDWVTSEPLDIRIIEE